MIGAPRPLPLAKPAAIDTAQAARYFGARGEPDEKTMALLETCALPLLAAGSEILWVCGEGFAEGLAPDEETVQILQLELENGGTTHEHE